VPEAGGQPSGGYRTARAVRSLGSRSGLQQPSGRCPMPKGWENEPLADELPELRSAPAGPNRDCLPPGDKELLPFMRIGRPFGKPLRNQEQRRR
jgi:hypothetical protein